MLGSKVVHEFGRETCSAPLQSCGAIYPQEQGHTYPAPALRTSTTHWLPSAHSVKAQGLMGSFCRMQRALPRCNPWSSVVIRLSHEALWRGG